MIENLKIHFSEINGYVNLSQNYKKFINSKIKKKFGSYVKCSKYLPITSMSLGSFLNKSKNFIRIKHLCVLLKQLNISQRLIENNIIAFKDAPGGNILQIKFPIIFNPIHIRIISCLIGDGNIHKTNYMMRWIQKDVTPMITLIEKLTSIKPKAHTENWQVTIPALFRKITCKTLLLNSFDLATTKIITQILKLQKEVRIAFLLGIIEDEATIDWKHHGGIDIRMSNKKTILALKLLTDSLNYNTSEITKLKNKGGFKEGTLYRIKILSKGIRTFANDISVLTSKYGPEIGLWTKNIPLRKRLAKMQ